MATFGTLLAYLKELEKLIVFKASLAFVKFGFKLSSSILNLLAGTSLLMLVNNRNNKLRLLQNRFRFYI